ncbi:AraC family transcriptional regulator [Microlunatus soli]|uniref:AraC-type DNA-binding protein n=1 Tax=Microlunatus soli TaxID=630515 RepID=A0A1H1NMJ1_9ACTN|nr:AraC family transcriptional regulator [Microlunatus soli]SDS00204.1 AraC-type DNA-binding protein [Microlunatus soli]
MDVFSQVIASTRAGRAKFNRTRRTGMWGNSYGPYPGAGFHVLLHGSCWFVPPHGEPVQLSAGDVVFLPHGARHGMSDRADRVVDDLPAAELGSSAETQDPADPRDVHADLLCGAYRLDRGDAHPLLRTLPGFLLLSSERHGSLRSVVDLLSAELAHPRPGTDASLPALLDLLLVDLLRGWFDEESTRNPGRGWPAALADPLLAAALNRMHAEPGYEWTVAGLGATVNMSKTTFARRFTALIGQPPMTYLTWVRLSTAARLLRESDIPVSAIAHQVGYGSPFAFGTAFRREFGTAPGLFRRRARQGRVDSPQDH